MKEEEILSAHHIGDVIDVLQTTTHHLYDPDELLTVMNPGPSFLPESCKDSGKKWLFI